MIVADVVQQIDIGVADGLYLCAGYVFAGIVLGVIFRALSLRRGTLLTSWNFGGIVYAVAVALFVLNTIEFVGLVHRVRADFAWELAWDLSLAVGSTFGYSLVRAKTRPIAVAISVSKDGAVQPEAGHGGTSVAASIEVKAHP